MTSQSQDTLVRNPFGVMDVPDPNGQDVTAFAASASLAGSADDENARNWDVPEKGTRVLLDGRWSSRWNGGADPTIPGDSKEKWKEGGADLRTDGERVYLLFRWDGGMRRGLIDARRDGANGLVGRYINLNNPEIMRPWIGLIVDNRRIDGRWPLGRLDFRR
jgi:hypothetical protein